MVRVEMTLVGRYFLVVIAVAATAVAAAIPGAASAVPAKKSSKAVCKLELKRLGKTKFTTRYGAKRNVAKSMRRCIGSKLSVKTSTPPGVTDNVSSRTVVGNPTTPTVTETTSTNATPTTFNGGTTTTQSVTPTPATELTSDLLCTTDPFFYRGVKASGCMIKFVRSENSETQLTALATSLGFTVTTISSNEIGSDVVVTFAVSDGLSAAQYEAISSDSSVSYLEPNAMMGT